MRTELRKRETNEQLIRAERMSSLGLLAEGAAQDLTEILAPVVRHVGALPGAVSLGETLAAFEKRRPWVRAHH